MNYNDYLEECEKIREKNQKLLEIFEKDLEGLSPKTINKHVRNIDFYIDEYLLREEPLTFERGISRLDDFLGYFFIRKCMWSTPAAIKSTAASIKKFYKSMMDHGKIEKNDYIYLCDVIKAELPIWQSDCEQYNDPDAEISFMPFW